MTDHIVSADAVLARVARLPPLPAAVHELEAAMRRDDTGVAEVVRIVASDQALAATALRLANSSFYGVSGRVQTLHDAVHVLGLRTLSAAVMTSAVMASFDRRACPAYDFDGAWRHALATALCAQLLAEARGLDASAAYTAGLLHDIGSLALASHFGDSFAASRAWSVAHDVSPLEAERKVMGIDHVAVGGMLAAHWHLAPVIVDAIRLHHDVPPDNRCLLLDVLHLADNITHALDLGRVSDDMVPPLSSSAWERVAPRSDELQLLFARVEARMSAADVAGG